MDLLPTLAAMAGVDAPSDRVIDGQDISLLFQGELDAKLMDRPFYYLQVGILADVEAVRQGNWKFRNVSVEYPYGEPFGPHLHNLDVDVEEKVNLVEQFPHKAREMSEMMIRFQDSINSSL